jgi:uncharacterized protein
MEIKHIHALIDNRSLPGNYNNAGLKETHISWIILTDDFAYKVKRPVKYSFADFSSPGKRKHFCYKELELNRRLAPDMYLNVLPVTNKMTGTKQKYKREEVIDHAVQMKRMDNNKEMDRLLDKGKVTTKHIDSLAKKISDFHKKARVINNPFNFENLKDDYSDIKSVGSYVKEMAGGNTEKKIASCIEKSSTFLNDNKDLINERVKNNSRKDCHGDLNAYNIFLYDDPVIFDCIEFNDDFRYIDILNEIAFLCVDLDFFGRDDLGELFCDKYFKYSGIEDNPDTKKLLNYYKSYRANIRAKVTIISAEKSDADINSQKLKDGQKYIDLMTKYSENI